MKDIFVVEILLNFVVKFRVKRLDVLPLLDSLQLLIKMGHESVNSVLPQELAKIEAIFLGLRYLPWTLFWNSSVRREQRVFLPTDLDLETAQ